MLLSIIVKNILYGKLRALLTVCGIGVSIAAFVALITLSGSLEKTLQQTYRTRGTDLIAIEKGAMDILSSTIDQSVVAELKLMPEVHEVSPMLLYFYSLSLKQYLLVYGWEMSSYLLHDLRIEGKAPQASQEAIMGVMAAKRLKKKVGDTLTIRGKQLKITGVYQSKSLLEDGALIMPLEELQAIKKVRGKVTALNIKVSMTDKSRREMKAYERELAVIQESIEKRFPDLEIKNVQSFITTNTPLFLVLNFIWAISVVAFLIVVLGIMNTMTQSVMERTKEIGIARAIGWNRGDIVVMVLGESSFLGFLGGVGGVIGGYCLSRTLVASPQLQGFMAVTVDRVFLLQAIALATVLGFLSGIYPALKAVAVQPIRALRYE